jgi:hypothetical protein
MRTICVLGLMFAASAFGADPKPDFTVTAEEFSKELISDPNGFAKKYTGKTVEVSGTVRATAPSEFRVMLHGVKEKPSDALDKGVACEVPPKLDEQLRGLARGQQVTVRGTCARGDRLKLTECEFVKVGPSTAIPVTVSGLVAEFKKDAVAARKVYDKKAVVARVEVLSAKKDGDVMTWIAVEVGTKGPAKVQVRAKVSLDKKYFAELEQVKPGDVMVVLADVDPVDDPLMLRNAVLLKEPPPGVKLPGDKK